MKVVERDRAEQELLCSIRAGLPELRALLEKVSTRDYGEDAFYRFYCRSPKLSWTLEHTREIVAVLRALAPGARLHESLEEMVRDAAAQEPRQIMEAFLHARAMLELVVRYGAELHELPKRIPSGWAAVLRLYGIR